MAIVLAPRGARAIRRAGRTGVRACWRAGPWLAVTRVRGGSDGGKHLMPLAPCGALHYSSSRQLRWPPLLIITPAKLRANSTRACRHPSAPTMRGRSLALSARSSDLPRARPGSRGQVSGASRRSSRESLASYNRSAGRCRTAVLCRGLVPIERKVAMTCTGRSPTKDLQKQLAAWTQR